MPCRGMIWVANHFNGWNKITRVVRHAFRYAISDVMLCDTYRVPKGTLYIASNLPAVKTAGYPYQMPTASAIQSLLNMNYIFLQGYQVSSLFFLSP